MNRRIARRLNRHRPPTMRPGSAPVRAHRVTVSGVAESSSAACEAVRTAFSAIVVSVCASRMGGVSAMIGGRSREKSISPEKKRASGSGNRAGIALTAVES